MLRIADGPFPAYLVAAADAVLHVPGVEVVLILATPPSRQSSSPVRHLLTRASGAYDWVERTALGAGPAALSPRRPGPWPGNVPIVRGPGHAHVDAIRACRADVLIDLAPEDRSGPLPVPPAGRWHLRYAIGSGGRRRGNLERPSASASLAESLLWIETGSGRGFETGIGVSALRRSGYSGDRDAIYWRSSLLPARRLASLVAGMTVPSEALDAPALPNDERSSPSARAWTIPPLARLTTTVAAKILGRILFRTGWLVLVRERDADQGIPHNVSGFEPIEAPAGRFYADPFVVDTPDGHRLYVEDCPDRAHRGRISTLRRAGAGRWTLERVALDDLEHRAYPHVLRTEAGLLVTPDSGRRGGVDLFIDRGSSAGLNVSGDALKAYQHRTRRCCGTTGGTGCS